MHRPKKAKPVYKCMKYCQMQIGYTVAHRGGGRGAKAFPPPELNYGPGGALAPPEQAKVLSKKNKKNHDCNTFHNSAYIILTFH